IDAVAPRAAGARVTVALDIERAADAARRVPSGTADAGELVQALGNLLNNAVDAVAHARVGAAAADGADRPTDVVLRVDADAERVRLCVIDRGPGIPPARLATIFEPFVTGKHGRGGSGLGLALVRSVVERHGGTIEVTNRDDGISGASFTLVLPRLTVDV
ncbi:MAG: HAMP domain-containing sensor histidine kinase, partial [Acidobacteriota bacterium]